MRVWYIHRVKTTITPPRSPLNRVVVYNLLPFGIILQQTARLLTNSYSTKVTYYLIPAQWTSGVTFHYILHIHTYHPYSSVTTRRQQLEPNLK